MANILGKAVGAVTKAPGAIVGFAGATAVGTVGGAIKATGQGIVGGAKAAGKLKSKLLGEAAEAAVKGGDDVVEGAVKYNKNAEKMFSFKGTDGNIYSRQGTQGAYTYHQKVAGSKNWTTIENGVYDTARQDFLTRNAELGLEENLKYAEQIATSGAGEFDGLGKVGEFAKNHPFITGGAVLGGGALIASAFVDDDE